MIYGTAYLDQYGRPFLIIQGESIKDSIPTETDLIKAILEQETHLNAPGRA